MNLFKNISLFCLSAMFISCGENTTISPTTDIKAISIDDKNISIYATEAPKSLSATVFYEDNTSADASLDMAWSSSDAEILNTSTALIVAAKNGGDTNITIDYASTFTSSRAVHVKKLLSINYSDLNLSNIGNPQVIYVSGNFENNETNITMQNNILWSIDSNATIIELNTTQLTVSVDYNVTSIKLSATLFYQTQNEQDFNKTFY